VGLKVSSHHEKYGAITKLYYYNDWKSGLSTIAVAWLGPYAQVFYLDRNGRVFDFTKYTQPSFGNPGSLIAQLDLEMTQLSHYDSPTASTAVAAVAAAPAKPVTSASNPYKGKSATQLSAEATQAHLQRLSAGKWPMFHPPPSGGRFGSAG
jgi:hypothetical protein